MAFSYLDTLNQAQKEAAMHGAGPLLIVAGAGTGKTTVITSRIAYLIDSGLAKPEEILALTFTDKAAEEMEERVDRLLPYGYFDLWIMTFHAFCERVLQRNGMDIGLPNDFRILSDTERWKLVFENFARFRLDYYRPLGNPTKFIVAMLNHFSKCKDEAIFPESYVEYAKSLKLDADTALDVKNGPIAEGSADRNETDRVSEIADAYHTYQNVLLENSALDFGDLITDTLRLFSKRNHILGLYLKQFKYILVDEFQDTNFAQYEIVKMLSSPHNNLVVVGDDDQAIYKFRGASISNILTFKKDYPDAKEIVLTQNYRSSQNILDLAYRCIVHNNPNRLEERLHIEKKLLAHDRKTGTVEYLHFATGDDEVTGVIQKIVEMREKTSCAWSDFAILIRSNRAADPFVAAFEAAMIPFTYYASSGLFLKPLIMDLLSYLKLLDDYHESGAMYRVINMDSVGFSREEVMAAMQVARKKAWSLHEVFLRASALGFSPEFCKNAERIVSLIKKHGQKSRATNASNIFLEAVSDIGVIRGLQKLPEAESLEHFDHLNQLYLFIKRFEETSKDRSLKAFLSHQKFYLEAGDEGALGAKPDDGPDSVKIMTVHGAKGLEFEHVFVVNMVDRRFPTSERKDAILIPSALIKEIIPEGDTHLEEERRLFYVAITRAKASLFFTSAENYGGKRKKKLSRFLHEAGLVNESDTVKEIPTHVFGGVMLGFPKTKRSEKNALVPAEIPKHLSFTQIKSFETCPWQYRYAFIVKIPVAGKAAFSFGKTLHSCLQKFFSILVVAKDRRQGSLFSDASEKPLTPPSLEDLMRYYEESWIDEWYENAVQKENYRKKGREILRGFFEKHRDAWPDVLFVEKGFHLKIGDVTLRGVMDRVDNVGDGSVKIVDYKTGGVKTEKTVEKDQLLLYQLAASECMGRKVAELEFYYLNENKPLSFLGKEKDLEQLKEKIMQLVAEIRKGVFHPDPAPQKCKYCDYKEICEYRKL
ncbi:MAG: ATP-dependent helicase [Parcubacteria group bacterium]|nr:ATP-dependent helicase [Parcubacteria group bacterium]